MPSYKQITGTTTNSTNVQHAYVFALPKSGTVYLGIFFKIYAALLQGKKIDNSMLINSPGPGNLFGKDFAGGHSECPGYTKAETNTARLAAWKKLKYYTDGWIG